MRRFFFFPSRRRHTSCSRDWSSDVCSSDLLGNRGGAARLMTFAQGFSVVLGEVSQGRLGVFVDRANRRDKTGVEKRLHAFAKLVGRAFGSPGDVRFESLAADLASRAVLCVE